MSNKLNRLVELLIEADPELANDIYFANKLLYDYT